MAMVIMMATRTMMAMLLMAALIGMMRRSRGPLRRWRGAGEFRRRQKEGGRAAPSPRGAEGQCPPSPSLAQKCNLDANIGFRAADRSKHNLYLYFNCATTTTTTTTTHYYCYHYY